MCISSITLAELLHGVDKSSMITKNMRKVEDFVSRLEVLPYDNSSASHYGDIRANLEKKALLLELMIYISLDTHGAKLSFLFLTMSGNLKELKVCD